MPVDCTQISVEIKWDGNDDLSSLSATNAADAGALAEKLQVFVNGTALTTTSNGGPFNPGGVATHFYIVTGIQDVRAAVFFQGYSSGDPTATALFQVVVQGPPNNPPVPLLGTNEILDLSDLVNKGMNIEQTTDVDTLFNQVPYGTPKQPPLAGKHLLYKTGVAFGPGQFITDEYEVPECICFDADTSIKTDRSIKLIKDITTKDTINGTAIKKVVKSLNPENYMVVFKKNSLGENKPNKDLKITGRHRVMYKGKPTHAYNLINNDTIVTVPSNNQIVYNLWMDKPKVAVVLANGAEAETLCPTTYFNESFRRRPYAKMVKRAIA